MVRRRSLAPHLAVVVALALLGAAAVPPPARAAAAPATYRNPVSRAFADTFADPAVVRAEDGW
jgi:arabinan endo-1,5-alpha-L-arabinosidase